MHDEIVLDEIMLDEIVLDEIVLDEIRRELTFPLSLSTLPT